MMHIKKPKKIIQVLLFTIIIISGLILFTQEEIDASESTACFLYITGNYDMHVGGCWSAMPVNCSECAIMGP
ncbi:MAG: hypothetical protein WD604_10470 [Balneolaceae bacterium]